MGGSRNYPQSLKRDDESVERSIDRLRDIEARMMSGLSELESLIKENGEDLSRSSDEQHLLDQIPVIGRQLEETIDCERRILIRLLNAYRRERIETATVYAPPSFFRRG